MFVGLMFLGWGVGTLVGQAGAGFLIGIGVGALADALIKRVIKKDAELQKELGK